MYQHRSAPTRTSGPEADLEDQMSIVELARPEAELASPLTRRERVVLSQLSEDVTLEQIATKLFVTRNTVKSQVRSLYRKLGVSTRAEALDWARQAGLR
jgi:DNA-binding NarL/FixJ family response regulator